MTIDANLFNFFAFLGMNGEVKRIPLSQEIQHELTQKMKEKISIFIPEKLIKFEENIGYKPEKDEAFFVDNFEIPPELPHAIQQPVIYEPLSSEDYEHIKFIFYGATPTEIGFTLFRKDRIIMSRPGRYVLSLHDRSTFVKFEDKMIVLDIRVDALHKDGTLYFKKFRNVKLIFGTVISEFYREATNEEIARFSESIFSEPLPENYLDEEVRKLIFLIEKRKILDRVNTETILKEARKFGIRLEVSPADKNKIKLPESKNDLKSFLKLLNDDMYESMITRNKYVTNSKRRIG